MIKRALISVSDKTGLAELGKALKHFQVEIISTGGTAQMLKDANIPTLSVSDYTGFPEMMDGRLKTLHPKVFGSILGRRDQTKDNEEAQTYGIKWVDLVVVNLYPFEKVARRTKKPEWRDLIDNIDIGGVSLIRAAAKNHEFLTVVTDPRDYGLLIQRMKENPQDPFDAKFRYEMAFRAFRYTALYDSLIAETLSHFDFEEGDLKRRNFPIYHSLHGKLVQELRYGENPHQRGALYRLQSPSRKSPLSNSLQGKELSFNNILDADAAWRTLSELPKHSTVIVKHNNPCGVAMGKSLKDSFLAAHSSDPESAFGGIVALSGEVDVELARLLADHFFEIICAESFTVDARDVLRKKKNLRLILLPSISENVSEYRAMADIKKVTGGYLYQDPDHIENFNDGILGPDAQVVTKRAPTERELTALRLAWVVGKNLRSNAVVITSDTQSLGIGCGQVNRKFASQQAADRSRAFSADVRVCGSDGFFPFQDNISVLKDAGVTAVVQPGGSIRDAEVIAACNEADMAMIFTKTRHFRH